MKFKIDSKHSQTNLNVSGGTNQQIGNLEALKLEKDTIRKFRDEKREALNKIILCVVFGVFPFPLIIPLCFIPKWIRRYNEANKYLQRAMSL